MSFISVIFRGSAQKIRESQLLTYEFYFDDNCSFYDYQSGLVTNVLIQKSKGILYVLFVMICSGLCITKLPRLVCKMNHVMS